MKIILILAIALCFLSLIESNVVENSDIKSKEPSNPIKNKPSAQKLEKLEPSDEKSSSHKGKAPKGNGNAPSDNKLPAEDVVSNPTTNELDEKNLEPSDRKVGSKRVSKTPKGSGHFDSKNKLPSIDNAPGALKGVKAIADGVAGAAKGVADAGKWIWKKFFGR